MAKLELIYGGMPEVAQEVPVADMSTYHIAPLTPEQFHKIGGTTEELDRYEAYQQAHPAEEATRHLYIVEGEQ